MNLFLPHFPWFACASFRLRSHTAGKNSNELLRNTFASRSPPGILDLPFSMQPLQSARKKKMFSIVGILGTKEARTRENLRWYYLGGDE
jgi:hypothetical protein